jgi:translation initiation factor 1A
MPKYGATHKNKNIKEFKRDFITKEDQQEYARVTKVLGDCRFKLYCYDGIERIGHARGQMQRYKIMINLNDILLVGLRTFEESKCDIIMKYTPDEVRKLNISEQTNNPEQPNIDNDDNGFTFEDI